MSENERPPNGGGTSILNDLATTIELVGVMKSIESLQQSFDGIFSLIGLSQELGDQGYTDPKQLASAAHHAIEAVKHMVDSIKPNERDAPNDDVLQQFLDVQASISNKIEETHNRINRRLA